MKFGVFVVAILTINCCYSQEQAKEDTLKYDLQEFIVVGTRTTEKILDIPYSVYKVDKEELSYGRKVSAGDVLADVPGLFLQSMYGNQDVRISVRGFGTRSNSGVRGVRILQDGIPESEPDGETVLDAIDFTSLGGVEVVKGNLSSLYANAPGGVVNFVSDLMFPENYTTVTNQVGQFGLRVNGFKTGYKTDDQRFLLSYNYTNLDGYRAHSDEYKHLVNAVYEAHVGVRSTISVLGNYVNGFMKLPGALTEPQYDADPFQADLIAVSQDFRKGIRKGRLAVRFKTIFGENDDFELEATTYGGLKELEQADVDYVTDETRYSLGALVRLTNKSQLFSRTNILSFGMEYADQSGPVTEFDNLYGNRGPSVENEYDGSLSNIGFYCLDHLNLITERFDLFLSGRFDKDVFERDVYIPYGFTDTTRVFQKFTPKVGLNLKLAPSVALYTSYGLGYDLPALSELPNTPLSSNIKYSLNPDLNAQQSDNFEFGMKGDIVNPESEVLRKLFFEVTFFNYIIKDEIVPFIINQKTFFRNAAKTNRTGVEAGIKCKPFEGLECTFNYTFTNFKYDHYIATVYGPSGSTVESYANNAEPSVPKHALNFILNYELELSSNISGLLQWDCDYVSSMFVNDSNSVSTPSYFYANPMAGIDLSFHHIHATAYLGMINMFDKRFVGFININDYYGKYYQAGEPRTVYSGLNIGYQF